MAKTFKHFPKFGGIDNQDAILVDYFLVIIDQENRETKAKMMEQEAKALAKRS